MQTKGFSIGGMLKFGWRTMKENFFFFLSVIIVMEFISNLPYLGSLHLSNSGYQNLGQFFLAVLGIILAIWMSLGVTKIALAFSRNEKAKFMDLFSCFPLIGKYFLASFLYFLLIVAGLILLVFPAFIWGTKYGLYPYFIIEKRAGPIEAFKLSAQTSEGAKWDIFGLWVAVGVINTFGFFCLVIGLFATLPTTWVALAYAYRVLLSQTNRTQVLPAETQMSV